MMAAVYCVVYWVVINPHSAASSAISNEIPKLQIGKEIISLVIHNNESRKILHIDLPNSFHTKLRIVEHFHVFDVLLGQDRRRAAN